MNTISFPNKLLELYFSDYMEKQCLELSCFEKEDEKRRITNKPPYFKAEPCYREQYIDLILFEDEGDGEYGYVSMLSKKNLMFSLKCLNELVLM